MIELNLTYEESKKILSLGYDFRRASNVFINEQGRIYNRANNYLAVARDITLYEIDKRPDLMPAFFRFIDHLTPCIPKAALEACLPILEGSYYLSKQHVSQDRVIPRDNNERWINYPHSEMTTYTAFLWAHDHYPKELRDKFNSHRLDLL